MGFVNRPSAGTMVRRSKRQALRDWLLRRGGVKMEDAYAATSDRAAQRRTAKRIGVGKGRGRTRSSAIPRKHKKPTKHVRHMRAQARKRGVVQ